MQRSLTFDARRLVVTAFVASRLDYCNAVLHSVAKTTIQRLQTVMNAAARLVGELSRFDHVTPVLRDALHWLPIQQRIVYKIAVFALTVFEVPAHHTLAVPVLHSLKLAVESVFVRCIAVTYVCQPQGQN